MQPLVVAQLLILLALANGSPLLAKKLLGDRFAWPLDGGIAFFDGRPLFGKSKTIRGIVVAVLAATAGAPLLGLAWPIGALVGATAMAGDLCTSFLKRRMNRPSSSRATGLDQIPESLLPLLACRGVLALTALDIAAGVALFFLGEVLLSRLFFKLHLRDEPY
jgi:CDP-2,3-bis-(O-geranylgeranyl)-sn-glycerol synthase